MLPVTLFTNTYSKDTTLYASELFGMINLDLEMFYEDNKDRYIATIKPQRTLSYYKAVGADGWLTKLQH